MPWTTLTVSAATLAIGVGAGWALWRRPEADEARAEVIPTRHSRDSLIVAFQGPQDSADAQQDDRRLLVDALRMVADQHGAAAAGLWVAPADGHFGLQLKAWSREPAPELGARELGLVDWASENDLLAFDGEAADARFVAVRAGDGDTPGALALLFESGAMPKRDALRYWLPRHATRMATMQDLLRSRAETAQRNYRLRSALRTAIEMQGSRDSLKLEGMFSSKSRELVDADWVVLARWDREDAVGEVRKVEGTAIPEKHLLHVGSLMGNVAQDGAPLAFPDARPLHSPKGGRPDVLVDEFPIPRHTGSMVLVPMRRSEDEPAIGVLACGHRDVGALKKRDASMLRDLATIAAGALATAWLVEDARAAARIDPLTELSNRREFDERFRAAIGITSRAENGVMALVLVDIDHFKRVNDTYGHDAGDRVLQAVSRVLARDRRESDTAARVGGEELALILPLVAEAGVRELAERLRERIEQLRVNTNAGEVRVTASFGVAFHRARGDAAKLFERADAALYAAKHGGRNRVEIAPGA